MIVNDVAGFIGPEVFTTAGQLERACLEDVVMAKLQGITMGLDVCSTFHMGIAPRDLRDLTRRIARGAAPAYSDGGRRQCRSDARLSDHRVSRPRAA